MDCDGRIARTTWAHSIVPTLGFGLIRFFCSWPNDQSCVDHVMPCGQKDFYSLCQVTYTYRGTSSTDPDNDIVSWSIDFGDGTSVERGLDHESADGGLPRVSDPSLPDLLP